MPRASAIGREVLRDTLRAQFGVIGRGQGMACGLTAAAGPAYRPPQHPVSYQRSSIARPRSTTMINLSQAALGSRGIVPPDGVRLRSRAETRFLPGASLLNLRRQRDQGAFPPIRPASMTPIGSPSAVQYSGRLTEGWPERLYAAVNGVKRFCRSKFSAGSTSVK